MTNNPFIDLESSLSDADRSLIEAYAEVGVPTDRLPYTESMLNLVASANATLAANDANAAPFDQHSAWRRLVTLRKAARLPRIGLATREEFVMTQSDREAIATLLRDIIGTLGRRDFLPFTPEFDEAHAQFQRLQGKSVTKSVFWQMIAREAK